MNQQAIKLQYAVMYYEAIGCPVMANFCRNIIYSMLKAKGE